MCIRDSPSELHDLPIEPVRAKNVAARLEQIAQTEGGLIALQPSRRNVLSAIIRNDFERLLIEGSLPILSFPAQQTRKVKSRRLKVKPLASGEKK